MSNRKSKHIQGNFLYFSNKSYEHEQIVEKRKKSKHT